MEHKPIERLPIKGGLVISKADAAERQLKTAIWLWFHDFDPVPIHGLASAALKVLWKLHAKHQTGFKTLRENIIGHVRDEYQRSFIDLLNETENFIKHADRDPLSFHTFSPEVTIFILIDGVYSLSALNGSFPFESKAFQAWFLINYPHVLNLPEDHEWMKAIRLAGSGPNVSKSEFYRLYGEANRLLLEGALKRGHP